MFSVEMLTWEHKYFQGMSMILKGCDNFQLRLAVGALLFIFE